MYFGQMFVAKIQYTHNFLHKIIGFLSLFAKQSSYWISQNPSSKFPTHNSKFPNQLSSQDFTPVYFSQMTKNSPKIYVSVAFSVTLFPRLSKQSQKTFFAGNLCLKIKYLWCQAHKYAETVQNRVIVSETQTF